MSNIEIKGNADAVLNVGNNNGTINVGNKTHLSALFERLQEEIRKEVKEDVLEDLLFYTTRLDGTKGLEEKLMDGGFNIASIDEAKRQKELYAKKALKFGSYPSAQQINLYLFASIKNLFMTYIIPLIMNNERVDSIMVTIRERVIDPVLDKLNQNGASDTYLNYTCDHVYGMLYYLTGMCHLNWKDYDNI